MDVGLPPCLSPRTRGRIRVDIPFPPQSAVYSVFPSTLFIPFFFPFFFLPSRKSLSENVESCFVIVAGIPWDEPHGRKEGNLSQLMGRATGVCLAEARIPPLSLCLPKRLEKGQRDLISTSFTCKYLMLSEIQLHLHHANQPISC